MGILTPASIPKEILAVCQRLREAGFVAYVVGGAVRDHLRLPTGEAVAKDFDLTTSAHPEQVIRLFGKRNTVPTGIQHGTVTVLVQKEGCHAHHREHVEVTTFRGEGAYSDGRRPDEVRFIDDLTEDLRRRDLTINAIAYDPLDDKLHDPFGGIADLSARLIRAVGDPAARFAEDGLRTMRAVRLAAQLGFALDPMTEAAIGPALPTLRKVSFERVRDELLKLLGAPVPSLGLMPMAKSGIFSVVLPPLPITELGTRFFAFVDHLERDPILRLSGLLWPLCGQTSTVEELLFALKLSNKDRERILACLATLPEEVPEAISTDPGAPPALRRYLSRTEPGKRRDLHQLLSAEEALYAGLNGATFVDHRRRKAVLALLSEAETEAAQNPPLSMGALALSGKDVLSLLKIPPGPLVGEILRDLFEQVLDDPQKNTKENLSAVLKEAHARCLKARTLS